MTQFEITNGSRQVVVTEQGGKFSARLYVNNGETATLQAWRRDPGNVCGDQDLSSERS